MPNVPNLPGVPILSSYSGGSPVLLLADAATAVTRALQPRWGIYRQDGTPVAASSLASLIGLGPLASAANTFSSAIIGRNALSMFSVVDFEFKQDWTMSDYPVEQGGFQSYDKVNSPFDVKVRVAAGGSESNRRSLISAIQAAGDSLALLSVFTPEATYSSCNISHYDYARKASAGAGLIMIDVWLVEIRVTATAAFQNTQKPDAAGQQGLGNVSPIPYLPNPLPSFK